MVSILALSCYGKLAEKKLHNLKPIELYQNNDEMNDEILKYIPINSSVFTAKKIMELNGFECKKYVNGSFKERENLDFLFCYRKITHWSLYDQIHQIAIIHNNDFVTEVDSRLLIRSFLD